jgi:hypothetical protein
MKKLRHRILAFALALCGIAGALAVAPPAHAIIGLPFTPLSFAGVARRTVRRSAYFGAAAAGAYGAYGAVPYGVAAPVPVLPPGCYPGAPCGGTVYQPMYQGTNMVYVPR